MNNFENNKNRRIDGRIKDLLLVFGLAIVLGFSVWNVFYTNDTPSTTASLMNEKEKRISLLLKEMDGVGSADVMIYETEEGVQSAVVICDGAKNFDVLIKVREAVATALGTEEKTIKVYLKKE